MVFVSNVLTETGGASKCVGVIYNHLNRTLFDPYILSETPVGAFASEYGIPRERCHRRDLKDVAAVSSALGGSDIVFALVGSSDHESEYAALMAAASMVGVKLFVLSCVFGLGSTPRRGVDLYLCHSMEAFLCGRPHPDAYVTYCPVPEHRKWTPRAAFRAQHGISESAFVIGYASADHRPEFYEVARNYQSRRDAIFLTALGRHDQYGSSPNIAFAGGMAQCQMPSLYDAADVILHTRTESFGYSVYQGIAAEKPIVALWTGSRNAFAEGMYPGGGYLARNADGAMEALDCVYRSRDEAGNRARVALDRVRRIAPQVQVPRVEALMLRKLQENGHYDGPIGGPDHWPGPNEISHWRRSRAHIEEELKHQPYI